MWFVPAQTNVGWYSTARWLANQSNVRLSSHNAYVTSRRDASAHTVVLRTQSGVYFGRFFCINGCWPGRTRMTDNGRSRSAGKIWSLMASR